MERKYLPHTIAKNFNKNYVIHAVADFETCYTSELKENVKVWAWGYLDYLDGEYMEGTDINSFLNRILFDKNVYDIGFHNLKFDGSFIIPALFKRGYTYMSNREFTDKWRDGEDLSKVFTHNITTAGQWFSITIVKERKVNKSTPSFVYLWDTLKLFPEKLSELAIQYNTRNKKIQEDRDFYEAIREDGHKLTERESAYLKADCEVLAQALRIQLEKFDTIFRTRASKAFTFFKQCCTDEAGNNNYKQKYEGIKQWRVPDVNGLEDYKNAVVRYLPREVVQRVREAGKRLVEDFEYYIPDYFTWSDFKKAYTGGISYVNPEYVETSVYKPITVIDVNSMYPYCLRNFPIPFGRIKKVDGPPDLKSGKPWIASARVSFKLKNKHNLPCIQIKSKYGRAWLRESTDYQKYGEEDKYNEDVIYFTSVDYETFLMNYDFTVHNWYFHYEFSGSSNIDGKKFIDKYYAQKSKADNVMVKIKNTDPNFETNPEYIKAKLDRTEAKVIMNSAYGKHGTKYFLYAKDSVYNGPDSPVEYVPETKLSRDPHVEPSHFYCPYAAFVTAYARRMLVSTWNKFEGRALYCDTDSIHFLGTKEDIPESLKDSIDYEETGKLGLWKVENEFTKGRYIRSKCYVEVDKKDVPHFTCAGATSDVKKIMTWDNFRVGFDAWKIAGEMGLDYRNHSKLVPVQYPDGVALEYTNFSITPLKINH